MIVGLILVGTVLGAVAASIALILGQGIWVSLLIYSGIGTLAVLAGALIAALRPDSAPEAETAPEAPAHPLQG